MKRRSKKFKVILVIVLILATLSATMAALWITAQTVKTEVPAPSFSFDTSKAPGWWTPGNYETSDADLDQKTDADIPLPIASINAFTGKQGEVKDACFVMAFYHDGQVDIPTVLEERKTGMIQGSSDVASVQAIATTQQTMQTPKGIKEYTYHQFDLNLPGQNIQKGNAFGFITLEKSYIEIRGVCPTAEMLTTTIPAIESISLR